MKQLTINWPDLEFAFEDYGDEFGSAMDCSNYLDLATGDVILIDEQVTDAMNSIIDELDSALDVGAGWTDDAIRATETFRQLAEAEKKSVLAAIEIDYGDSSHFERIPRFDSRDCFGFIEEFIATVNDDDKSRRLREAVSQRKPFRRFRDVLADDQRLERQWLEFENVRQRKSIVEWLHSIGIKPTNPDVTRFNPAPLPDLRKIMFSEVRRFVRLARDIEGVRRIALIGPLTTDKEFPRAIDLVVTVSDHCELAPLAKLGRELTGHMNNHSSQ